MLSKPLGHPLHPMLVHFPIALWTLSLPADLAGWLSGSDLWWTVSYGCIAGGLGFGLLAVVAGVLDYARLERTHAAQNTAVWHMLVMGSAWTLFAVSLVLRPLASSPGPSVAGTVTAGLGFVTMAVGGWLGARLVYSFGVGVDDTALRHHR